MNEIVEIARKITDKFSVRVSVGCITDPFYTNYSCWVRNMGDSTWNTKEKLKLDLLKILNFDHDSIGRIEQETKVRHLRRRCSEAKNMLKEEESKLRKMKKLSNHTDELGREL